MSFKEEADDVKFVSALDDQSKKKAKEELNENEKDRLGAVQSFRSLVLQQDWLKTRTDFSFLLRFLRAKKFSQLTARDTLQNYWTSKSKYPEWFANIDPADKKLQDFMRCGFYYSPLKRDRDGRRIIIERVGNLNIDTIKKDFGIETVFKNIILVCEWLIWDENVQVNGLSVFVDMTGLTMAHHKNVMNMDNAKKMMHFYQNALPARMKAFHIYNEPPIFDMIFGLFSPLIKEKMKSRMQFHGKNMANAYDFIDKAVLPEEYLPDDYKGPSAGPEKQIIEDMIADMNKPEFRDYIRDVTSGRYDVDIDQSKKGMHPVASFRKLNID